MNDSTVTRPSMTDRRSRRIPVASSTAPLAAGVITGYIALADREKLGLGLAVVVELNLGEHNEALVQRFEDAVAASPQIVRCVSTTGKADYILTVYVSDIASYERFLHETLFKLPGVQHVYSSIVLREVKAEARLPVPGAQAAGASRAGRRR